MDRGDYFKLIIAVVVSELAGVLGAIFTTKEIPTWYAGLIKPALNPPSWIFGPVWTTLFALIGIALFLVWRRKWKVVNPIRRKTRRAWMPRFNIIAIFIVQYVLNIFWSVVFFGLHRPDWAFFVLLALWCSIIHLMANFYRVSRTAAWLLVPYLLWVTFAGYLNLSIWLMN